MIKIIFASDRAGIHGKRFASLESARRYARCCVGEHPIISGSAAISIDGRCKILCAGTTLSELFPDKLGSLL